METGMRILLFRSLIISFLINLGCGIAVEAEPSIADLHGTWVPENSLEILRETLSPSAAGGVEVIISHADNGERYRLKFTNFREGDQYHVSALSRTKEPQVYKLRLSCDLGPAVRGAPHDYRVKLQIGAQGIVRNIIFLDGVVDADDRNRVFVRIPVPWRRYLNRLVFAGIWRDKNGRLFSFCECGEGHAPGGQTFTYDVPLSLLSLSEGRDPVWVEPFSAFQASADGYYSFERIREELRIFSPPHPQRFENKPALILNKLK